MRIRIDFKPIFEDVKREDGEYTAEEAIDIAGERLADKLRDGDAFRAIYPQATFSVVPPDAERLFAWRFCWDRYRQGRLEGVFVATEARVKSAIGKTIDFGEALGKHSNVRGELEETDLKKLDISDEAIRSVTAVLGETWSGRNPIRYYEESDDYEG